LAALAEAVAELRDAQRDAAQAAAARAAAERLYAAARSTPPAQPTQRPTPPAQLAGQSSPASFTTRDTRTAPTEPRADRHECDGCHHPGHVGLPADDASTHSPAHQTVMSCSVIRGWLSDDPDMGSAPT